MPKRAPTHKPIMLAIRRAASEQYEARRGTRTQRMYDNRWARYSKQRLQLHPWCVACENRGEVRRAVITDHVIPHKGNAVLFWDETNHQSLCKEDHDRKTALEDGGFGNRVVRRQEALQGPPGVIEGGGVGSKSGAFARGQIGRAHV